MAVDDRDPAARAADALAPESALFADHDIARFGTALYMAARGVAARPWHSTAVCLRTAAAVSRAPSIALERLLGGSPTPEFAPDANDRRFSDPAWQDNPAYFLLLQCYLATGEMTEQLLDAAGLSSMNERKARLALSLIHDALAPTNFLLGNPAALKRAFDTGGVSLLKGARNLLDDVLHNRGRPRQVDTSAFTVGRNLAATPCKVVYRNELMEVLQYEPQTDQVHAARSCAVRRGSTSTTSWTWRPGAASSSGPSDRTAPCSRSATSIRAGRWLMPPWMTIWSAGHERRSTWCARSPVRTRSTLSACASVAP